MKPCSDKLSVEQARLLEIYLKFDSEMGAYEYAYAHGSDELRAHFDEKERQDEEDKSNHCITN